MREDILIFNPSPKKKRKKPSSTKAISDLKKIHKASLRAVYSNRILSEKQLLTLLSNIEKMTRKYAH